jgi:hypothetical protein
MILTRLENESRLQTLLRAVLGIIVQVFVLNIFILKYKIVGTYLLIGLILSFGYWLWLGHWNGQVKIDTFLSGLSQTVF